MKDFNKTHLVREIDDKHKLIIDGPAEIEFVRPRNGGRQLKAHVRALRSTKINHVLPPRDNRLTQAPGKQ